ncbi:MAG: two-component regulator propeller domain-containing protein [Chloroherpetonaceae bacterium]|nr:two-component regulator propeller domain-containing protein [Chloroherpetonaceae bacterium]
MNPRSSQSFALPFIRPLPSRARMGILFVFDVIIAIAFCSNVTQAQIEKAPTQYVFQSWQSENGLPSGVLSILQSKEGFLYFGTYEGVFVFDGIKFAKLQTKYGETLKGYVVRKIMQDSFGNLWLGTTGNGLILVTPERFVTFTTKEGLPDNNISAIYETSDTALWVGTRKGLAKVMLFPKPKLPELAPLNSDSLLSRFQGMEVRALAENRDSLSQKRIFWIGTDFKGLYGICRGEANAERFHFTEALGLQSNTISVLHVGRVGELWIGGLKGLSSFLKGRLTNYDAFPNGPQRNAILDVETAADGDVWVGTTDGVHRLSLKIAAQGHAYGFTHFGESEGLSSSEITDIAQDSEKNIWVGTARAGANKITDGSITTITTREGLAGNSIYAILPGSNGEMWIGAYGGLQKVMPSGEIVRFNSDVGLPTDVIRALAKQKNGDFWVGTFGRGLYKRVGNRFKAYDTDQGLPSKAIRSIVENTAGQLLVGTRRGIAIYNPLRDAFELLSNSKLQSVSINSLSVGKSGVWVSSDGAGVWLLKDSVAIQFDESQGLSSEFIFTIHEDAKGIVWIGTKDGLFCLREGEIENLSQRNPLLSTPVFQILEDDDGMLWLGTVQGIMRVKKSVLNLPEAELDVRQFGKADGMRTDACTVPATGAVGANGVLWFPTNRGVSLIQPKNLKDLPEPAVARVIEIQSETKRIVLPREHQERDFDAGTNRIRFMFTSVTFYSPEKIKFRYKLNGFDDKWIESGTLREATYTNLSPGDYSFLVKASNSEGRWPDTYQTISISIKPFIYESAWFKALMIVIGVLAVFGFVRFRTIALEAGKKELEKLVEERTRSEREEKRKAELARSEAEQEREKALEADKLKTELLGIAAHDLKNPLQSIGGFAALIIEKLEGVESVEANKVMELRAMVSAIKRSSDRMFLIVTDLLQTAASDTGVMSISPAETNVSRLLEQAIESSSAQAAAKEQRISTHIEQNLVSEIDSERIYAAFDNLISNAIKYSPVGKPIYISLKMVSPPSKLLKEKAAVQLKVQDEGLGLSETDFGRLFKRFQRLSAKPTGGESSTGLGLSIAKKIIDMHEGIIWAESEGSGKGTTFYIELPLKK